jgi:hypothetical protein
MAFNDAAGNGQAQAFAGNCSIILEAVEDFPDFLLMFGRNAQACIGNGVGYLPFFYFAGDGDR